MNNKSGIVLALVLSLVVGFVVYFWQENRISSLLDNNQKINAENQQLKKTIEEAENKLKAPAVETKSDSSNVKQDVVTDDFKYDKETGDYYGKLTVTGYATLVERPEGFCEENCPIFTYVFFNVLNTDNKFLDEYIGGQGGNSFVRDMSIGLGCIKNNILWRMNDSDEFGMQKYTNSPETSKAILSSSKKNPITIELERYLFTSGGGAPDCYSHFAKVDLAK